MTSRERVTAALNHQEPDRAPVDLGELFKVDFRTVRMKGPDREIHPPDSTGTIRDEFNTIWKTTDYDYVPAVFSYADAEVGDLMHLPKPDPLNRLREYASCNYFFYSGNKAS